MIHSLPRLILTLCFIGTATRLEAAVVDARPLPRIMVGKSNDLPQFQVSGTGAPFRPMGSSYLPEFHQSLAPGIYDPDAAKAAMEKMVSGGFNVIRTWAYHGHFALRKDQIFTMEGPDGAEANTPELWQPYIDNLCHFIGLANQHGLYVHLVIDREPDTLFYRSMVAEGFPDVEGFHHREFMTTGSIKAKEIYIRELIENIRRRSPALLSTIFAYEIRNEIHANTRYAPFNKTSGKVETAAGIYDMGDPASRLACQEDNLKLFLTRTTAALKQADPEALATASVFGFLPVGKAGMADKGLLPVDLEETRWPIRLSTLAESPIDFVSFNSYHPLPWNENLAASGIDHALMRKKPFLCTEFGAHRNKIKDPSLAASTIASYREAIFNSGFQGAYLFTWDTTKHTRWTMTEQNQVVFDHLKVAPR